MKKYLLSLIIFVLSSNITISANSYSIFGGTYDYDDDNSNDEWNNDNEDNDYII